MLKLVIILAAVAVCYGRTPAKFYVYTQSNPASPQVLNCDGGGDSGGDSGGESGGDSGGNSGGGSGGDGSTAPEPRFNAEDNTIILVHGHAGSLETRFNTLITTEILLHHSNYNVIVVDWGDEASNSYSVASSRVSLVATDLANCITGLQERSAVNVTNLHLVGFDLGAHLVGIAARSLIRTIGHVGRITGLDPSGSGWGTNSGRLSSTDARYVEVIHTDDTGPLSNGIGTAIGAVNFYANGGSNQPGCWSHTCSHDRAYELFAASMFNANLVGYPCRSKTQLNLNTCRGDPLPIGGMRLSKPSFNNLYRINTKRNYPF